MLDHSVREGLTHQVEGHTVAETLGELLKAEPGLRGHLLDEGGALRPHVSVFVDGARAELESPVGDGASIRILHAVSGG